jgi:sulfate adenylyltransferase subunit 1
MDLLRFATAGSVDDGKSTLIGRLLYDSQLLHLDTLEAAAMATQRKGESGINLALLTDGLRAEREQGITIDVAYRYFSTPERKFILADSPGHVQYTRNMVTAISNTDLVILIIDARNGLTEQSRRHTLLASLFGINNLVVCVNKMDLVSYDQQVFLGIQNQFLDFCKDITFQTLHFLPVSALLGDNIVNPSIQMNWFTGLPLLGYLNTLKVNPDQDILPARFPVQMVIRPQNPDFPDFRALAGNVLSGNFCIGDRVKILPSGYVSTIAGINEAEKKLDAAGNGMAVTIELSDDFDVGRGDMLVPEQENISAVKEFNTMLCWLNQTALVSGGKYLLKHGNQVTKCLIGLPHYKLNATTFEKEGNVQNFQQNDIGYFTIKTAKPVSADNFKTNRYNSYFIIINELSNNTVAAGIIHD